MGGAARIPLIKRFVSLIFLPLFKGSGSCFCFNAGGGRDGDAEMFAFGHAEDMSFERHGRGVTLKRSQWMDVHDFETKKSMDFSGSSDRW